VLSKDKQFTNQAANLLVDDALKAYWHVMSGGQQVDGAEVKTISINGTDYRYLGEDIDTKEKLKLYLGKFYTEEILETIMKDGNIVEKDGKMVQPNADGGSLMHPSGLSEEIKSSETEAQYEFKFEVGDTTEHVPVHISFKNDSVSGWKVDTSPKSIYQSGNQIK
jgi:iseA protein